MKSPIKILIKINRRLTDFPWRKLPNSSIFTYIAQWTSLSQPRNLCAHLSPREFHSAVHPPCTLDSSLILINCWLTRCFRRRPRNPRPHPSPRSSILSFVPHVHLTPASPIDILFTYALLSLLATEPGRLLTLPLLSLVMDEDRLLLPLPKFSLRRGGPLLVRTKPPVDKTWRLFRLPARMPMCTWPASQTRKKKC